MYYKITEFIEDWQHESAKTLEMIKSLPNDKIDDKANENVRTMHRLVAHIAITIPEMMSKLGLTFQSFKEDHEALPSLEQVAIDYKRWSDELIQEIKANWKDENLPETHVMYGGEPWTKGQTLKVLILHQTHHRGQLTVLMRLAGVKVPGVYGPSKEEWAAMGMPAMD